MCKSLTDLHQQVKFYILIFKQKKKGLEFNSLISLGRRSKRNGCRCISSWKQRIQVYAGINCVEEKEIVPCFRTQVKLSNSTYEQLIFSAYWSGAVTLIVWPLYAMIAREVSVYNYGAQNASPNTLWQG